MMQDDAPERIYGWLNTQMSIARFYGGLTYKGHTYVIAVNEPDQPLVRKDLIKKQSRKTKTITSEQKSLESSNGTENLF